MANPRQQTADATRGSAEPDTVNPMVEVPTEGLSTMAGFFQTPPTIVDDVVETRLPASTGEVQWVIRPSIDVEDMTVGDPHAHFAFKPGVRYRVPLRVAQILYGRNQLMEQPYAYQT